MREQRFVGGYSAKGHLFPFRTEKLSFAAPMVLPLGGRVGRRQLNIISRCTLICAMAFFVSRGFQPVKKEKKKSERVGRFGSPLLFPKQIPAELNIISRTTLIYSTAFLVSRGFQPVKKEKKNEVISNEKEYFLLKKNDKFI